MLKRLIIFLTLATVVGSATFSRCLDKYVFNGLLASIQYEDPSDQPSTATTVDTIRGAFIYVAGVQFELVDPGILARLSPRRILGVGCDGEYYSSFIDNFYRLSFDKAVRVHGKDYPAGFNLLELKDEFPLEDLYVNRDTWGLSVMFGALFLADIELANGPTTISCEATEQTGEQHRLSTPVVFALP